MGTERHAVLGDLAQLRERHDLKAATVGKDGMWPAREFMQAAKSGDALGPRPKHQVIRIAEDDIRTKCTYLIHIHCLDSSAGSYRHEGGGADCPARHCDFAPPCLAVPRNQLERKFSCH